MRKYLFLSIVILYCGILFSSAQKTHKMELPVTDSYSAEEKVYSLSKLWSEVKYNFVNIDLLPFDLDSLYKVSLKQVASSTDDLEYHEIMRRFMAALNDGHTAYRVPDAINDYYDYTLVQIGAMDEKLYLTSINRNIGLDSTFLCAEILEIDNVPTKHYMQEFIFPKIGAATERIRWKIGAIELVIDRKDTLKKFKVRKADGVEETIELCYNESDVENFWWTIPARDRRYVIDLKWQDDIAILKINSFDGEEVMGYIDNTMKDIRPKATGLIIDIRDNSGGWTDVGEHLLMYILDADTILGLGYKSRINNGYYKSQGNYREEYADYYNDCAFETVPPEKIIRSDSISCLNIPVVILIGINTASAAEDFLIELYEIPDRPIFIGQETYGSTGAPLVVHLDDGSYARICTLRATFPYSGNDFVVHGIKPDIEVPISLEDFFEGRDVTLEKALTMMLDLGSSDK